MSYTYLAEQGGGILGGMLLGHTCVCAVEIEHSCRKVLLQRQRDGILPKFPIWDDVTTFDGKPWRGRVDIVCGGFPCQDISCAGKGVGITGERSGLWGEMARIIGEIRPKYAFVENSPMLVVRGLDRVLGDLAEMRYDAKWCVLGAKDLYYPIIRQRLWIMGIDNKINGNGVGKVQQRSDISKFLWSAERSSNLSDVEKSWLISNNYGTPVFNGLAAELDEIKAIGNGQVPAVAAAAWEILTQNSKD